MWREGEMRWTLVAFWVCLLGEPGLTAAIPVATEWPVTDTDDFTTIDDHMSWWTTSDDFGPTATTEYMFMLESTPPPPTKGMSELNPGSPSEVNSSGLVESGTPGSPLASNDSRIVSTTRVPSKVEPTPQGSNTEGRTEIQEQEASAKVNSSNPSMGKEAMKTTPATSATLLSERTASASLNKPLEASELLIDSGVTDSPLLLATSNQEVLFPTMSEKIGSMVSSVTTFLTPGSGGEGSLDMKDEDSDIGSGSTLFIPWGETPTGVLLGPQEEEMPQSSSDSSRDPAAPSSVPGLLSSNTEQLPAGGIEPASARESIPPEAEMVTAKQTPPPTLPFDDSLPSSKPAARSPEPSGPVTVLISHSPGTRPDLDTEPVAAVGRGDADSSVAVTVSNSDREAIETRPSADVGLSPENTSKVPPEKVQNAEGAASSNPSPAESTKDTSVDLAPLSNTPSDSSSLGSDTAPTLPDMQADSGDATVTERPEELGGSAGLIEEEVLSAPSAMESESATRGTYAAEGSGNGDVLPFGEEMVGTTLGINNNQDETSLLPLETLPSVDKTSEAATARSAVIADDGSGDFPPFLAESGTLPKSDRLSGEADPSTSSGTPLPESFSPEGQAGDISSSTPSSENLASSLEDGIIVGGSRADNASRELIANEAVTAAGSDSQTGTGLPSSDTVSGLTEEGQPLGALAGGEISSQPFVPVGETIATNHVLGEESPSVSASPTEIGEALMANLISGVESPSASTPLGAKSPLSSGTQPPLHPVFPVSNQPSLSNMLNSGSAASTEAQLLEGPFNMIGKETLEGPSGAESQTVSASTGMMGSTGSDLASENGSQLSPESAKRIQPLPSEGAEQLEVFSSISGTDASMAPSAGESQSASLSPERTKANGSLTSASEGSDLPPDVAGYEAGEGIADVSEKIPSLPVLSTESGAALLPSEGVETSEGGKLLGTLADGETASQPSLQFGETMATNNVLGEGSPSASVPLTAGYMGSLPSPDAVAAVAGPGASKGITQLEGSSAVSEKETPSSLATESQSSGTSAGEEASGSLGKIVETTMSEPVVSMGNQLFPDGSTGAEEKQLEGSSSMSEKEASLTPLATESQSASPSIDGMEVAASSKNWVLIPSLHSTVASEHGIGPESISIVGGDKSSLAPSSKDSHSPGMLFGEEGSGQLGIGGMENSGSSVLFNKGSASLAESGMSPENGIAQLGEKFGSIPGGESIPKPSSADEPGAQNYNISGGTVLSGSSSLEGSLAAQGTPQQAPDITDSSQLPLGNENMSDNGASPDKAGDTEPFLLDGSRQPGAQSLGDVASGPSSGLFSQTAEDTSEGKEMVKIDSSSSDSVTQVAGPSLPGLASPSNELLAPLWNSEGRGDADSFVSTVDKGTPMITGEEGGTSLPGAQLSPSGKGELPPVGEAKPGAAEKAIPQSSKDKITGSSDEPSTSVLTSSNNMASGLESAKTGSMDGSSILPASGSSAQIKPAVRVSEDSSGSTKSSPKSKPEAPLTAADVSQEKTKSSQSKSSDKKKENKKADKKQDSKKTDKKKESKNSDSNSKAEKAKDANENSGKLRVVPAVSTSTPPGANGQWLYKLGGWMQVNYRQKCLDWVNHEPQPSVWNWNLPACPCSVQQGLSDRRYTHSQNGWLDSRLTMLRSSMPNKYGAGVRCLYDKSNNQLVEGRQERVWKHWRRSSFADEEMKLYHWCCNQAGSQQVCDRYNQKRAKIGCDGYKPPVQAAPTSSSSEEEAESRERD